MKILFIHQNFPGQFAHLAPALLAQGHEIVALMVNRPQRPFAGIKYVFHTPQPKGRLVDPDDPLAINEIVSKLIRGESAAQALYKLKQEGFTPDLIVAHPGWGEAWFIRDIYPAARLLIYCEYFYQQEGGDHLFDPEFFQYSLAKHTRLRVVGTHLLQAMLSADAGLSPTQFQRGRHPDWFQPKIDVIHDGINTEIFRPRPDAFIELHRDKTRFTAENEIVTFVARQLEPYRGVHTFLRALPRLLQKRPHARVVIVGGEGLGYGPAAPKGKTWKNIFLDEVKDELDLSRVHFVGKLPHATLTQLLQISTVHSYLTYPFVLSWSMMEAMSIGCLIVGSKTAPVEELIEHGKNGLLCDFFDHQQLADTIADALANRKELQALRDAARQTIVEQYDLRRICLPKQLALIERLASQ